MTDAELIAKAASVVKRAVEIDWPIDEGIPKPQPALPKSFYPGGKTEFSAPGGFASALGRTVWGANKAYNPALQVPMSLFHNSDPTRPSGLGGTFRNFANSASTLFQDPRANRLALNSIPGYQTIKGVASKGWGGLTSGSAWKDAFKQEYNSDNPIWGAMRANRAYGKADMTRSVPSWWNDPRGVFSTMQEQGRQGAKMVEEQGPAVY